MKKELIILLLGLLIIIPAISAEITEIKVQTLPGYEVQISVSDSSISDYSVIKRFKETADEKGRVSVELTTEKQFDLIIYIKKDGQKVSQGFDNPSKTQDYLPGEPIYIELISDWFEPEAWDDSISNETLNNETETNQTTNETDELLIDSEESEEKRVFKLTGSTIFGEDGIISWKRIYYIVGAVILIIVILIFLKKRKSKGEEEIKTRKLSELKKEQTEKKEGLKEAETELKKAQERVNQIKNKDKIDEVKKRLIETEKELVGLRKGE